MLRRFASRFAFLAILLVVVFVVARPYITPKAPIEVTLFAINDFHGNLKPPAGGIEIRDPADPTKTIRVAAGGSEAMATLVKQRRAAVKNSIFVAAGDLVGASPMLSALFNDEPTIESLDMMGLALSAVGNHEFDRGVIELLRKQNGGCSTDRTCLVQHPFMGAKYRYLAASTIDRTTGKPILPPYEIRTFDDVPIAFVGLALKGAADMVKPTGIAGVEFRDEAATINALVPEIRAKGVETIVVLIHEGGFPTGGYDECPGISGPIVDIVKKLDPAVRVVVSGHTHKAYVCRIDGRLVTSGDKYGTIVTEIGLTLDANTKTLIEAKADNLVVRTDTYSKDAEQTALIAKYEAVAAPMANRPIGRIAMTIDKVDGPKTDTPIGNLVADAMWEASRDKDKGGARFAMTNPGGLRQSLVKSREDGVVTFGELQAVLPFDNSLVVESLTGAEIARLLERQWENRSKTIVLQVSSNVHYAYSESAPAGAKVLPGSISIDGTALDPAATYRVVINDFLQAGGDRFPEFTTGRDVFTGDSVLEAVEARLATGDVVAPPPLGRIERRD